jgi:hypothetical protein
MPSALAPATRSRMMERSNSANTPSSGTWRAPTGKTCRGLVGTGIDRCPWSAGRTVLGATHRQKPAITRLFSLSPSLPNLTHCAGDCRPGKDLSLVIPRAASLCATWYEGDLLTSTS